MGRYKTKHAPFARRKCENGGWGQGRRESVKGSCSPGKGTEDLEDFPSCSVKSSWAFYSSAFGVILCSESWGGFDF